MTNTEERKDAGQLGQQPANDDKPENQNKKTILLGKVKTDEEARLAAEIEKLRG